MEGDSVSPPFEWVISRICEEFHCLPTQAYKELMIDPLNMAIDIMELRSYANAKEILDHAKSESDIPKSSAIEQVWMVQHELLKRRREADLVG